jgi:3'(2'), 5'-bisphosphate nucleotidase
LTASTSRADIVGPTLRDSLSALVARAGAAVLRIATGSVSVRAKADGSPVSDADAAADAVLADGLARLLPGMVVVSEETVTQAPWSRPELFALVDPLDGTKEFLAGRGDYCVNLALIADGRPIAGFLALPALGLLYRGRRGEGAERITVDYGASEPVFGPAHPIATRPAPAIGMVATISRSHLDATTTTFLDTLGAKERHACGSALKFCRVAEGEADVYPRLARTCEWDIAAGHALIEAAGGIMRCADGEELSYGHAEAAFAVADFIAWGDRLAYERWRQRGAASPA